MSEMLNEQARVLKNEKLANHLYLMSLEAPGICAILLPGQFVHMKIPGMEGHILRRPFSVYEAHKETGIIDILYQEVGFGTNVMTKLDPECISANDPVELIGPVGNPWNPYLQGSESCRVNALVIGGGVGAAPLYELVKLLVSRGDCVDVVLGAQTKDALVTLKKYTDLLGVEPESSTDDGSYGVPGFATSIVEKRLIAGTRQLGKPYDYVAVCGPPPLMRIVSSLAIDAGVRCEVSLERHMACGIGACLSCVADTTGGKKRVCVDGPVFDAAKVVW